MNGIIIEGERLGDVSVQSDNRFKHNTRPAEMVEGEALAIEVLFAGGVVVASEAVVIDSGESLNIFHFEVKERLRKMGVGSHTMDIIRSIAEWGDYSSITGFIGGGDGTKEFLLKSGMTESGVTVDSEQGVVHINQEI